MTPLAMTALRRATHLALAIPESQVLIRHSGRLIVQCSMGARRTIDPSGTLQLCTNGLRMALGQAWSRQQSGCAVALFGLGIADDPSIELGLQPPASHRPGDIVMSRVAESWIGAFVTTADQSIVIHALESAGSAGRHPSSCANGSFRSRTDDSLGTTLVWAECQRCTEVDPMVARLQEAVIACCALEFNDEIAGLRCDYRSR